MLKGFRDFILRGNIVELAIAVVIGTAFTAIVAAFTANIINPVIAAIGSPKTGGLAVALRHNADGTAVTNTILDFGKVITAAITFLITAAVVYFIFVIPMNRLNARFKKGKEETIEAAPTELQLLIEIRDLLSSQQEPPLPNSVDAAAPNA